MASSNHEVSTLEQQLQEYRAKLAAYDNGGVAKTTLTSSVSLGAQPQSINTNSNQAVGGGAGSSSNPAYFSPRPKVVRSASGNNIRSQRNPSPSVKPGNYEAMSNSVPIIPLVHEPSSHHDDESDNNPPQESSFHNSGGAAASPQEQQQKQQPQDSISQLAEGDVLFNYDEDFDGGSIEDEPEEELTWRSDPEKSMSDWTIRVMNRVTRQKQVYYVHRNVLAVGKRKSEYFVRFFRSHDRVGKSNNVTEVHFESVAASAMPFLLDYMYSSEGKLEIATINAVGLRYLAQYFGMRGLHKRVMSFITRDMTMDNVKIYYEHTVAVDDSKVSEIAGSQCAQNILSINTKNPLLKAVDPLFFRRIMLSREIDSMEKHLHMSQLLAEFCILHRKLLDDQDFIRLTDEQCLPHVHYKAALTLMEMEADLGLVDHEMHEKTSLQDRCLRDLASHWEELSTMKPAELSNICRKLPSAVVTTIMIRSLGQAKKTVDVERRKAAQAGADALQKGSGGSVGSASSDKKTGKRDYDAKLATIKREHQQTLDEIKGEFETNLVKMREAVVEKDKYITEYWNELKRFERVSNQPEGKMVQSTPSSAKNFIMPGIGNQPTEGLVLSKPKGGGKFPLFVYKGGD